MVKLRPQMPQTWIAVRTVTQQLYMNANSSCWCQECSRDYQKVLNFGFPSLQFPHCLPNGNYDELQCVNLACYCINPANLTISSYWAPIFDIEKLPCCMYNIQHQFPTYISFFKNAVMSINTYSYQQ